MPHAQKDLCMARHYYVVSSRIDMHKHIEMSMQIQIAMCQ